MVIFGAGASYDSYPSVRPIVPPISGVDPFADIRPPLADQLFSNRESFASTATQFPACLPVIPLLRHFPKGSSVERVLEGLRSETNHNPRRHVQLAAVRHYLQFIIYECERNWRSVHKGVTNYTTLLDEIEGWRKKNGPVCLVTFNYDTMLEQTLPAVGVQINTISDYIESASYVLIKLHGSVNWARQVSLPLPLHTMKAMNEWEVTRYLIENAQGLQPTDGYLVSTARPIGKSDTLPLIPALAIPVIQKQEYECPRLHLEVLDQHIPLVTKILVVGWRASEDHFLQRLSRSLKPNIQVMVVAGKLEYAQETSKNLADAGITANYKVTPWGFSDFIRERAVREFLRS